MGVDQQPHAALPAEGDAPPRPRASRRRTLLVSLVSGLAALTLATTGVVMAMAQGGAPQPAPIEPVTSSPAPVAEEAGMALRPPEPRLALGCDELVSAGTIAQLDGSTLPALVDGLDPASTSTADLAALQSGATECVWRGPVGDQGTTGVWLWVLPDGGPEFRATEAERMVDRQYSHFDTVGDASQTRCSSALRTFHCSADVLVDGWWVSLKVSAVLADDQLPPAGGERLDDIAFTRTGLIATELTTRLADDPPLNPAWVAPELVYEGEGLCEPAALDEIRAAFGDDRLDIAPTELWDGVADAQYHAVERTGFAGCQYAVPDDREWGVVSLFPVRGAEWAMDGWLASPPVGDDGADYVVTVIEGTDGAITSCQVDHCEGFAGYRGSLVRFSYPPERFEELRRLFAAGLPG